MPVLAENIYLLLKIKNHMKNKSIFISFVFLFIASCAEHKAFEKGVDINCQTLHACISEIGNVEYSKYGISKDASLLAEKFPDFGEEALIELIGLLKSDDPTTLYVVGYAISSFPTIDEKYLSSIKYGIEKDVPWLPRALGVIKSAEAAEYAVKIYLNASSSPGNQEAIAVVKQGERALPFILAQVECKELCDDHTLWLLAHIVGEMDSSVKKTLSEIIIMELISVDNSQKNKRNLLGLFFKMGESGSFIEDKLYQIAKENPELGLAINGAYIGIKSKYSGSVFASHLKSSPDIFMIRDAAEMGPAARDAGPVLVELLSNPDRDIRLGAARALGYLQYEEGVSALIPLINEKNDVRLNWVITESLGMIAEPSSIDVLIAVSENHWYPVVRESAKKSWHKIKHGKTNNNQSDENEHASDFFKFQYFGLTSCSNVSLIQVPDNPTIKLNRSSKKNEFKNLTYDSYVLSYGADDEAEQFSNDPDGIINVNRYNMVEHKEVIKQVPDVALKIDGGWLAGSDRGEWGGELVYIPDEGEVVRLLDTNVEDVYKFGDRYIVVSGLAHLGINNGQIFQLHRQSGHWQIEPWINLPGAPETSGFVETGELLINTIGGGSILISLNGNLRMAPCE